MICLKKGSLFNDNKNILYFCSAMQWKTIGYIFFCYFVPKYLNIFVSNTIIDMLLGFKQKPFYESKTNNFLCLTLLRGIIVILVIDNNAEVISTNNTNNTSLVIVT